MKVRVIERPWEATNHSKRYAVEEMVKECAACGEARWFEVEGFIDEQKAIDFAALYAKGVRVVKEIDGDENA